MKKYNSKKYENFIVACGFDIKPKGDSFVIKHQDGATSMDGTYPTMLAFINDLDECWFDDCGFNGINKEKLFDDKIETLDECLFAENEMVCEIEIQLDEADDSWTDSFYFIGTEEEVEEISNALGELERTNDIENALAEGAKVSNVTIYFGASSNEFQIPYFEKKELNEIVVTLVESNKEKSLVNKES